MTDPPAPDPSRRLIEAHPRSFRGLRYVYPVLSRRAGGISVGVNLNLDKLCNFDCVYCQVNRGEPGEKDFVDLGRLREELETVVDLAASGGLYDDPEFRHVPGPLRRLNDIALSGDGEPTTYRNFDEVAEVCAEVRRRLGPPGLKLVLITNASMFHRPRVERGLAILDANGGEIWAKLDAGTEAYYRTVVRSSIPYRRILDNLLAAARARPIVIQSLFMRLHGEGPPVEEQEAYCRRLADIVSGGGRIKLVQIYTIARPPAESWVAALPKAELDALADLIRRRIGLDVVVY